ncbi:MAG: hypothetical protein KDD40_00800 [Bdellovibrionales bacterium]|nr:hypothetical protein [Bdellovibrionales bacterium]
MALEARYDLLIVTPSIDHALLEKLSKEMKIVVCEYKEIGREIYFKVLCLTSGKAEKYYFPKNYNEYAIAKIIGEKIRYHFGVPQLVDFDLRVRPMWIGSYFPALCGSDLILRYSAKVVRDNRLSWLTGLSKLLIAENESQAKQLTASHINPIEFLPIFKNFSDKFIYYKNLYSQEIVATLMPLMNEQVSQELYKDVVLSKAEKKVLIISYCSPHGTALGAVRPAYWHRKLQAISSQKIESFFVTTLKTKSDFNNFYALKDETIFAFSNHRDWKAFENILSGPVSHQAATWTLTVYKHLPKKILAEFDAIVITGNPFYLFNLPNFWGEWEGKPKIYLDYRDPFALNTRFKYSEKQRNEVKKIEEKWNKSADKVIAVNSVCRDMVVGKTKTDVLIIENGYDEEKLRFTEKLKLDDSKIHFVYAGSVFRDRNIVPLIHALDQNKHQLHIAGRIAEYQNEIDQSPATKYHGLLTYEDVNKIVDASDIAVLLLSGCSFVSTTKIYDYIALNKFILALSDNPEDEKTFLSDFASYTNKVLLKNETCVIADYLAKFKVRKSTDQVASKEVYSRLFSTTKLADDLLRI